MFRDILRKYKEAYRVAETKREKRDIVAKAIEEFKSSGGRFLDRVVLPSHESSGNKHCYEIVEGPAVSLKARQAFRYLLRGTEIDDDPRGGRNTPPPSEQKSRMLGMDSSSQKLRPPTISNSPVGTTGLASFVATTRPPILPSQVEQGRSGEDLTTKDVMDIQRLASFVTEAPMLASIGTSSYYCPTTSPWRQQGLIPLSFLPTSMRKMSDTASPGHPEMILNSMKYGESWATDNANTMPGLLTSEILGHGGQYPTIPDMSRLATRAKLLDSYLDLYHSTTDSMVSTEGNVDPGGVLPRYSLSMLLLLAVIVYHISSQYRNLVSERSSSQLEESRIIEHRAVARALMEHRLRENRLAALVAPDLQRIMLLDNRDASPSAPSSFMRDHEKSHQR